MHRNAERFKSSGDFIEKLPHLTDNIKELLRFLDGFGLTFEVDCDYVIEASNKHVVIEIYSSFSKGVVVMNCKDEWGNPFILPAPSGKRQYKSLRSYILFLIWMHERDISYSALTSSVTEYGCTFDTARIDRVSKTQRCKHKANQNVVSNKVKNEPLSRQCWC